MPQFDNSEADRTIPEKSATGSSQPSGISRRGFLKGAGITAAGTAIHESLHAIGNQRNAAKAAEEHIFGPGPVSASLRVNGKECALRIEPRVTLAEALHTHLGMTGTKIACDHGACSSCTVLLGDIPVNSCMMLAVAVGSQEVTTIEGMERNGVLHPLQAAFVKHDAMQCGFCTPGMVMSCAALLRRNATPSYEDVRGAISGNLCRCGCYSRICEAAFDAATVISAGRA